MKVSLLFCCALFISLSSASILSYPSFELQTVEIWSEWLFVNVLPPTEGTFTVTISVEPADFDISHTTLKFDAYTRQASFRVKPKAEGTYTITFTDSEEGVFANFVSAQKRTINLDHWDQSYYQNYPSEPIQFRLSHPSESALEITPSSDTGSVLFHPAKITIPGGAIAASFRVLATVQEISTITFEVTGNQVDLYAELPNYYVANIELRSIYVDDLSDRVLLGHNSTTLYAYTDDAVNKTITVTPTAVDTVFYPSTFEFTPTNRIVPFTFISSSPSYGQRAFYFDVAGQGADDYYPTIGLATNIRKKSFTVQLPSAFVLNKKTYLSVRIAAPSTDGISVFLYAANLGFAPNNITFSGTTTSIIVEVLPHSVGPDEVIFLVEGPEKDWFNTPTTQLVQVTGGTFSNPKNWYIPELWVGIESPRIPVRVTLKPDTNVTLIPTAPDLIFKPTKLTFTAGSQEQYFTITPTVVNSATLSENATVTITFLKDGGDHWSYLVPEPVPVVVKRKLLQFKWSVHVTETGGVKNLFLGKQYEVWGTAVYGPTEELNVVPTNPHITFDPPSLRFSSSTTHVRFTVTVNSVVGVTGIDFILGGKDGAHYATPDIVWVNTAIRPLYLYAATITADDRATTNMTINIAQGYNVTQAIKQNHVYSIVFRSTVIPDSAFTITPRSHHVSFSPSSFELTPDSALVNEATSALVRVPANNFPATVYQFSVNVRDLLVAASFSVEPLSPGMHEVWFELSGAEGGYYDIPDHLWLNFNKELRFASELPSSAYQLAVSSILVLMSILLVLM